jgi:hypothetical protein
MIRALMFWREMKGRRYGEENCSVQAIKGGSTDKDHKDRVEAEIPKTSKLRKKVIIKKK